MDEEEGLEDIAERIIEAERQSEELSSCGGVNPSQVFLGMMATRHLTINQDTTLLEKPRWADGCDMVSLR